MMVPNFPNMFMLYGPNSQPLSGGTGLPDLVRDLVGVRRRSCIVADARGGQVARRGQGRRPTSATTRRSTTRPAKLLLLQEEGAPEKNYYVNEYGRLQVNAPWYGPEFHRMCTNVDWDEVIVS